jgi:hypothetical protein
MTMVPGILLPFAHEEMGQTPDGCHLLDDNRSTGHVVIVAGENGSRPARFTYIPAQTLR